jgi:hypothetical protein
MQGNELLEYLAIFPSFQKHFKGLFPIDNLPKSLGYRKFLISNTDVQEGDGKHWISFFQTNNNFIEVFDSLGIDNNKKTLLSKYCNFRQKQLVFNTTAFQDSSTSTCGHFVLYFCIERLFNLDLNFKDFLELIFEENVSKNEQLVAEFCSEIKTNEV